ncbi:thermonuclease family protein, partial [Patescibacteria group bacterium]|nr:thermonuclease family protein [Patescibacteria group bacterium]
SNEPRVKMERYSPRYLVISIVLIILGLSFLWYGLKPPNPAPLVEIAPIATTSATYGIAGERVYVSKVVDGDTIVTGDNRTVRFIGIDTPETVDPRRPVGCFGKEASNEVKKLLSGKEVILQKDISDKDMYDRILRYIYLPLADGTILFVNDYLAREGFAKVMTYPPDVKFDVQFREAEKLAKEEKRGLWGKCHN